jgi:hypothetical protein
MPIFILSQKYRKTMQSEKAGTKTKNCIVLGFVVLTAVVIRRSTSWDITPCSPLKFNRSLGLICLLHLQGREIIQAKNKSEAGSKLISQVIELLIKSSSC